MQVEATKVPWLDKLHALQGLLTLAFAASLPLSMTVAWVLLIAAFVSWIVELVVCSKARQTALAATVLKIPIAVLCSVVLASGLFNGGLSEGWRSLYSLKAMIVYLWSSTFFARDEKLASRAMLIVLCVGAVAGVWGTIQQVFNFHPFGYPYLQGTGFLGGPMPFAGQMEMLGMMSLGILLTKTYEHFARPFSDQKLFLLITVCNLAGLFFAGERGAWLGGLAGAIAIASLLSVRAVLKIMVALAVLGLLSWFTVPLVKIRVQTLLDGKPEVSTQVRFRVWSTAIEEWKKSPVIGVGFLKFPHLDIPEAIVPGRSKDINHAHSNYLQFLSTTGIVGVLAFIYLYISMLIWSWRLFKTDSSTLPAAPGLGAGLLGAVMALIVAGIFEYNFGTAQVRMMQWFLLGLLSLCNRRSSSD